MPLFDLEPIQSLPARLSQSDQYALALRMVAARNWKSSERYLSRSREYQSFGDTWNDFNAFLDSFAESRHEFIDARNALALDTSARGAFQIARRHPRSNYRTDDCAQEAFLAALKRTESYDPAFGTKPSTHAHWGLRCGIDRYSTEMMRQLHDLPQATEIEKENIADCYDENDSVDPRTETFLKALHTLSQRDQEILSIRFGLDGSEPQTIDMVANRYGVTKQRIGQITRRATKQLRAFFPDLIRGEIGRFEPTRKG